MFLGDKLKENPFLPLFWIRSLILRKLVFPKMWKKGFNILSEYWDCLIILDACRYDFFEKIYGEFIKGGKLERRTSLATETTSFLLRNFNGKYDDIVYVTANPFVDELLEGRFHRIVPVWKYGWSNELGTVHPRKTYEYALKALKRYKNKRLIVHFIQPHFPFISPKIEDDTFKELRNAVIEGREPNIRNRKRSLRRISSLDLYVDVDRHVLEKAYESNLRLVLPYVYRLMLFVRGRSIVTADHGEAFGERLHRLVPIKVYGHPPDIPMRELLEVPWLVFDNYEPLDLNKELAKIDKRRRDIRKVLSELKSKL